MEILTGCLKTAHVFLTPISWSRPVISCGGQPGLVPANPRPSSRFTAGCNLSVVEMTARELGRRAVNVNESSRSFTVPWDEMAKFLKIACRPIAGHCETSRRFVDSSTEEPPPPASRGAVNAAIITPQSPHQQLGHSTTHRIYPANVLLAAISSFKRHFKHSTFDNFGKKKVRTQSAMHCWLTIGCVFFKARQWKKNSQVTFNYTTILKIYLGFETLIFSSTSFSPWHSLGAGLWMENYAKKLRNFPAFLVITVGGAMASLDTL